MLRAPCALSYYYYYYTGLHRGCTPSLATRGIFPTMSNTTQPNTEEVLRVASLTFRHERGGDKQVSNVSFSLRAGRTFGVLGGNECGKTTLAHLLLGQLVPTAGGIELFGEAAAIIWRRPRWVLVMHCVLGACCAAAAFLAVLAPSTLTVAAGAGAWALPCLLVLLESVYGARTRGWFGLGGGGTVGALANSSASARETGMAPAAMLVRGVAYISSEHDAGQKLPEGMTIEEAIGRHMPLPRSAREARRREVRAALKAAGFRLYSGSGAPVGDVDEYLESGLKCGELSGGQKHLVYMLSVLASRPRLLICDDCLCGLDIDRQSSMVQLLQTLQLTFGMAILWMTVDLTSFTLMAHDAAFMCARAPSARRRAERAP